jgi:hypothetical protein
MQLVKLNRTAPSRWRSEAAYTLAELWVAFAVIAVTAVALFAAFSSGFAMVGLEREDLRATQIMTRRLEGIRLCTWSQLPTTPINFVDYYNPAGTASNSLGTVYTGTLTVTNVTADILANSPSYLGNMRLVTVSVRWTNYSSGTTNSSYGRPTIRTRKMQTLVARYGIQNYIWGSTNSP